MQSVQGKTANAGAGSSNKVAANFSNSTNPTVVFRGTIVIEGGQSIGIEFLKDISGNISIKTSETCSADHVRSWMSQVLAHPQYSQAFKDATGINAMPILGPYQNFPGDTAVTIVSAPPAKAAVAQGSVAKNNSPYQYQWSNGQEPDVSNLAAGDYATTQTRSYSPPPVEPIRQPSLDQQRAILMAQRSQLMDAMRREIAASSVGDIFAFGVAWDRRRNPDNYTNPAETTRVAGFEQTYSNETGNPIVDRYYDELESLEGQIRAIDSDIAFEDFSVRVQGLGNVVLSLGSIVMTISSVISTPTTGPGGAAGAMFFFSVAYNLGNKGMRQLVEGRYYNGNTIISESLEAVGVKREYAQNLSLLSEALVNGQGAWKAAQWAGTAETTTGAVLRTAAAADQGMRASAIALTAITGDMVMTPQDKFLSHLLGDTGGAVLGLVTATLGGWAMVRPLVRSGRGGVIRVNDGTFERKPGAKRIVPDDLADGAILDATPTKPVVFTLASNSQGKPTRVGHVVEYHFDKNGNMIGGKMRTTETFDSEGNPIFPIFIDENTPLVQFNHQYYVKGNAQYTTCTLADVDATGAWGRYAYTRKTALGYPYPFDSYERGIRSGKSPFKPEQIRYWVAQDGEVVGGGRLIEAGHPWKDNTLTRFEEKITHRKFGENESTGPEDLATVKTWYQRNLGVTDNANVRTYEITAIVSHKDAVGTGIGKTVQAEMMRAAAAECEANGQIPVLTGTFTQANLGPALSAAREAGFQARVLLEDPIVLYNVAGTPDTPVPLLRIVFVKDQTIIAHMENNAPGYWGLDFLKNHMNTMCTQMSGAAKAAGGKSATGQKLQTENYGTLTVYDLNAAVD